MKGKGTVANRDSASGVCGHIIVLTSVGKDSPNSLFQGIRFKVYGDDRMKRTVMLTRQIADSGQIDDEREQFLATTFLLLI